MAERKVKILGGMAEFVGKVGWVVGEEGTRPRMLRVQLDGPVFVQGVGWVKDDLWERKMLKTVR